MRTEKKPKQMTELSNQPIENHSNARFGDDANGKLLAQLLDAEMLTKVWYPKNQCEWLQMMRRIDNEMNLNTTIRDWFKKSSKNTELTENEMLSFSFLSRLLQKCGFIKEAVLVTNFTFSFFEKNQKIDAPILIPAILARGRIDLDRKNYDYAKIQYERALAIGLKYCDTNSNELGDIYYEWCVFNTRTRNFEEAKEYLTKCKSIREINNDYAGIGDCINDAAVILRKENISANYLDYYQRALAMFEKGCPIGHPEMGYVLHNISVGLWLDRKWEESTSALERGFRIAETFMLPTHPTCVDLREKLCEDYTTNRNFSAKHELLLNYLNYLENKLEEEKAIEIRIEMSVNIAEILTKKKLEATEKEEYKRLLFIHCAKLSKENSFNFFKHPSQNSFANKLNLCALKLKNEMNEFEAARVCYEFALLLNPDVALHHSNFALLLWSCLNENELADSHFKKAIELNPNESSAHCSYALFLTHAAEDFATAETHFEKALSLSPYDTAVPVHANYATLEILKRNYEKAWGHASQSIQLHYQNPDRTTARPLFSAAAILMLKGESPEILLGQLKTLFQIGIHHVPWKITALLENLKKELSPDKAQLMTAISEAINSKAGFEALKAMPAWQKISHIPLHEKWKKKATKMEGEGSGKFTHIYNIIILDESGSMYRIKEQAINGLEEALQTIKAAQQKHSNSQRHFVSLVTFNSCNTNTYYSKLPCEIAHGLTDETYKPSSFTPLYDAMGMTLTKFRYSIDSTENTQVLVTIITDGQENSSKDFNKDMIQKLIEELKEFGYVFTYIGANHDVEKAAAAISISNRMSFQSTAKETDEMFKKERNSRYRFFERIANDEPLKSLQNDFFDGIDEDKT